MIPPSLSVSASRRRARRVATTGFAVVGLAILALGLAGCGGGGSGSARAPSTTAAAATPASQLLDPASFERYLAENPGVPLVNVHVPYAGHLAGTTAFVPYDRIGTWSDLPADKGAPVAIYCRSGNMSAEAATTLASLGYTNVVELAGGMQAWVASGRQLLQQAPPS